MAYILAEQEQEQSDGSERMRITRSRTASLQCLALPDIFFNNVPGVQSRQISIATMARSLF